MKFLFLTLVCLGVAGGVNEPRILSSPIVKNVSLHSTAYLPCSVSQLGSMVLLWKRGSRVIFAGDMKVRRDDRLRLSGTDLVISGVRAKDGGEYTCQVETDNRNPMAITHRLEVLQPPSVHSDPTSGRVIIKKGSAVTLECKTSGNPQPRVTWTKKNQDLNALDYRINLNGRKLVFINVTISHSGLYTCTAQNGVGRPVSKHISMQVLYAPSATAETSSVLGGVGCELILVCMVRGFPQPEVAWYKETMILAPSSNSLIGSTGMRNSLLIPELGEEDFGNYSCVAFNDMGRARAHFSITGIPGKPEFSRAPTKSDSEGFSLSWTTSSFSPLTQYRLFYKQIQESHGVKMVEYAQNSLILHNHINLEQKNCTEGPHNSHSFTLTNIEPGSRYQVSVRARNKFGWSVESDKIDITTPIRESPPQEGQIRQIDSSSSISTPKISLFLFGITYLLVHVLNLS